MKRLIAILFSLFSLAGFGQVRVPDTETFSLQHVINAVEDHAGDITDTLDDAFNNADAFYFDGNYDSDDYAPENSMKRFRNYGPHNDPDEGDHPIMVPDAFSPNGDGIHDFFEVYNLEYYPDHEASIYAPSGGCNCGGNLFYGGELIYRITDEYHLFPWDGTYQGSDCPIGNYTFTLKINGELYTNKTIYLNR